MTIRSITVADGKYTLVYNEASCQMSALRNGEPWRDISVGDNLMLALMHEIETLRATTGAPVWFHAECDDPDRSGFYQCRSDAQTQVNDHGGVVTALYDSPVPVTPMESTVQLDKSVHTVRGILLDLQQKQAAELVAEISKLQDTVAELETDRLRLDWLLPIVCGDSSADRRTLALAGALMTGLDKRPAVDAAMLKVPV